MRFSMVLVFACLTLTACGDDDARDAGPDTAPLDAARDAVSETGGDVGHDAGADSASSDAGPETPVDPDELARAGLMASSCGALGGLPGSLGDLSEPDFFFPAAEPDRIGARTRREAVSCLAALTSCDGVFDCTGASFDPDVPDCSESCDGDVASICDDGGLLRLDCRRLRGTTCVPDPEGGTVRCARPTAPAGAPACDGDTFVDRCEGGSPRYCVSYGSEDVEVEGLRCPDLGLVCAAGDFSVYCAGPGAACGAGDRSRDLETSSYFQGTSCAGDTLSACVNGGTLEVDCTTFATGASCYTVGAVSFCGFGDDCDPRRFESEPSCAGDAVSFCNFGRTETFDCTDLGFAGCDTTSTRGCRR